MQDDCSQGDWTALMSASSQGDVYVALLLLERGGQEEGLVKSMLTAHNQVRLRVKHPAGCMLRGG